MNRRDLLTGSAAALLPVPGLAAAKTRPDGDAGALPMPAAQDELPPAIAPDDPSRLLLDGGWLFHAGDVPMPSVVGHGATYANAKAGVAQGAAAVDYDDSDWRAVTLPHDWVIEQGPDRSANVSQGYRKRGFGWYRRALRLDPAWHGQYIELQFGGIATHATIWVNGIVVAHNWSGYNSIAIDITPMARFGDELNSIAIRVDAEAMEGWWYEGAGLYRHAWLAVRPALHIETDGVHADPRQDASGAWSVPVTVTLANSSAAAAEAAVEVTLFDPAGRRIGAAQATATVGPLGQGEARCTIPVASPALWSIDRPALYDLRVSARAGSSTADERRLQIGFRTIRFDAATGFHLNGQPTKIKGVCLHQDHAGVGVAMPDALWDWRVRRLKAMGCNAIRSSHNAPATELLDACDRHGILVMDENRNFNPSPEYMRQLEWLVRRDRNRPSVILWSVFNEEPMQGTEAGYEMVRRMSAAVKALDTSRPVTAAMNDGMFTPRNVSTAVDVVGFNYQPGSYDRFHAEHPDIPLTSSEDTSAFMTRGVWTTDRAAHVMASYDDEAADWGATHRASWKAIATRPFVAGTFVWTGFDYHGEPTPFEWPSNSSVFGILDLCGFPKMAFYLHRAQWVQDRPLLDLTPHWNWPGREGQPITVMALTNADRVTLSLNGKVIGEQVVDPFVMPRWQVPYAPGRLEAVATKNGKVVAHAVVETTGAPVALRLTPDRSLMRGDGEDAQPWTVDAIDAQGRHVPDANLPVTFAVEGGTIIGLGNGDANSMEAEQGTRRSLYAGLAQVVVRANPGAGPLVLRASSPSLRPAQSRVRRVAIDPRPAVATARATQLLADWRRTPLSATRPDPAAPIADNDMNSLLYARAGTLVPAEAGRTWSLYRARFVPRKDVARGGGTIAFANLAGRAELRVDGILLATKKEAAPGPLEAQLPPGAEPRTVTLLVDGEANRPSGFGGLVQVRAGTDRRSPS